MGEEKILEVENVSKHFGAVVALDNVSFELRDGETLGLVGDNGAGKSTLIKILSGAVLPSMGTIKLFGKEVNIKNPMSGFLAGIETIYQDLALFDNLDITRNIFAGREYISKGIGRLLRHTDDKRMRKEAFNKIKEISSNLLEPSQMVKNLSGGQRQAVAITKTLFWGKKIIIMDEPTAALGVQESNRLLDLINETKKYVRGIIIISHNIEQIIEIADRAIVLRTGRKVADIDFKKYNGKLDELYNDIIRSISGSDAITLKYKSLKR